MLTRRQNLFIYFVRIRPTVPTNNYKYLMSSRVESITARKHDAEFQPQSFGQLPSLGVRYWERVTEQVNFISRI